MKPKLMLIYDYFYPAYKAGGPVQSMVNMARSLQDFYDISVITGAGDLNDSSMLKGITPDAWNKVKLPGAEQSVAVWYASAGKLQKAKLRELFAEIKPSIIYINGMFSLDFVVRPLQAAGHIKTVVCPRGMLQRGALQGKRFKKKAYLAAVKLAGYSGKQAGMQPTRKKRRIYKNSLVPMPGSVWRKTFQSHRCSM